MRFIGTFEAKLDDKCRVFLPASFRRILESSHEGEVKLYARKDAFENCMVLYPEAAWNARLDEMQGKLSHWSRQQREVLRTYVSQSEVLTIDKSGRILLSKRFAPIFAECRLATFLGMDDTIELWPGDMNNIHSGSADDAPIMGDEAFAEALQILMV